MADSIFTKIINGEIPAHKIYEDDQTIAFLDIHPMHLGHTLVVPKKKIDHIWDLSDADYQNLMQTAKNLGQKLRKIMQTERVGLLVNGSDVPHVHIHLIPFNPAQEEMIVPQNTDARPDHQKLALLAEQIRSKM